MPQYLARMQNKKFFVEGDEAHHLSGVARAQVGDVIKIFDGNGKKFEGLISAVSKKIVEGDVTAQIPARAQKRNLTLCFAPVSRAALEEVLDKCTQVGVYAFQPVITERTEHDILKKLDNKIERWNSIILSAVKQCETSCLPKIYPPIKFNEALKKYPHGYFAYEKEEQNTFDISALQEEKDIAVFIGPVGGFSEAEARAASAAGLKTITLGANIMRAETACIAASVLLLQ